MQPIVRSLLVTAAVIATPLVGASVVVAVPAGPGTHRVQAEPIDAAGDSCGNAASGFGFLDPAFARVCRRSVAGERPVVALGSAPAGEQRVVGQSARIER
ncbi:hypothetical protein [Streptomyces sp. SID3343]|uniref:hypothetical protein n=1 Tax=Streptomyces sp. SID3343 TaxID=2690260 RepID=UPI001369E46D|nr:hypothetical protein [Streptomyces sp. SID3343]MYW00604.1 hypothetical protein [Streptomyces sp. SID3343]